MPVHFSAPEMAARKQRLLAAMAARKLDGLLLFAQESDYWLTGYDSFGFCFFQCLYVGADGRVALLTRSADLRQAQRTSNIEDIRDLEGRRGRRSRRAICARCSTISARAAASASNSTATASPISTAAGSRRRSRAARPWSTPRRSCPHLRTTKSAEETRLRTRGGAPFRPRRPRGDRGDESRRRRGRNPRGDASVRSSPPAAIIPPTNSSSARAPTRCSAATRAAGASSRADDQLTLEFAGVSRHYHAAIMRTHVVGRPKPLHAPYHAAAREALDGLRGRVAARPDGRRRVRRACARSRRPRPGAPSAQRLRLFARRQIHAVLDGRADVLRAQRLRHRARPGLFPAHDPDGQRQPDARSASGRTYLVGVHHAEPLNAADLDLVRK